MSSQTTTRKRKSDDGNTMAVKKVKKTKSAAKPAPLKSALKKTKSTVQEPKKDVVEEVEEVITLPEAQSTTSTPTLTPDQTAALLAGFSSDEDSASEDENDAGIPISSLPAAPISKTQKSKRSANTNSDSKPTVLSVGRIPHGFHEPQMRAYFSQFGEISNMRLLRNRKTGRSQHHAFIEFADAEVADIVRRTMDKYLLFGRILQVKAVPREQVGEGMWKSGRRGGRNVAPRNKIEGRALRAGATRDVWDGRIKKEEERRNQKMEKMKEMGYEFDMPELKRVDEVPVKVKVIEDIGPFSGAEENVETVVESEKDVDEGARVVKEVQKTKKRPASGKTEVKKVVKKVKA